MIASVLPKTDEASLAVVLCIAVKTDILHQTDAKTRLQALHTYMTASYNSAAVTEMIKAKNCEQLGNSQKRKWSGALC